RSTAATGKGSCSPGADFSLEVTNITDNGFVFPWMQFVRIQTKGCNHTDPDVYLCQAGESGDPDDFINNTEGKFCNKAVRLGFSGLPNPNKQELVYRFVPSDFDSTQNPHSMLIPGRNYAICTAGPKEMPLSVPYCVRFSVYVPFFQYPDWPIEQYPDWHKEGRNDGGEPHYTNPALYVVKNDEKEDAKLGRTPVVIFGIVDPQMLENIGADNDSWHTVSVGTSKPNSPSDTWNKQYKPQVMITDPIPTLTELQRYFEQDYCFKHNGNTSHGIRVLLAQMPPERAKQLAEHLPPSVRFDLIISAADNALATPNQNLRIEPAVLVAQTQADPHQNAGGSIVKTVTPALENGTLATPATFIA